MSSDSEDAVSVPDDSLLEQTLRDVVKSSSGDDLTVNNVRAEAEERLGLDSGFFKTGAWKAKSKDIITEAVSEGPASQSSPPPPPKVSKAKKAAPKPAPKPASKPASIPAPKKRASKEPTPKTTKRQKRAVSRSESESDVSDLSSVPEDEDDSEADEEPPKPVKKQAAKQKEIVVDSGSEDAEVAEPPSGEKPTKQEEEHESEMSDVLDEAPPKKSRQKSASAESKTKAKPAPKAKKTTQPATDLGPDEAEIKRLQGWLVKCGIRKLWHKELASYDSNKSKIKHLKDMLTDTGMTGRYSQEKAEAIKEQRELAADLEAVQEGAKKWGHGDDEDGSGEDAVEEVRPRRRAAAAARFVDFGDSGEESD